MGIRSGWRRPVRSSVAAGGLLGALLPVGLAGQIPGGRPTDLDLERARFRATVLGEVQPLMDSWRSAWGGQGSASVESHYAGDAVLATPGGTMIGGRAGIGEFAGAARSVVGTWSSSMLDFAAGDGLAYVYGTWRAGPTTGDAGASGRLVTVLVKVGERWMIRSQVFAADTLGADLLPVVERPEPLPGLSERVTPDPESEAVASRRILSTRRRESVYHELLAALASLRRSWTDDDARAVRELMGDDAWLQAPGRIGSAGPVGGQDLEGMLPDYGGLNTVELDFDVGGTLAYLSGRYYVEGTSGPARSGTYIATFRNLGSGWLIRSLVFA